jgi:hypothetical protein
MSGLGEVDIKRIASALVVAGAAAVVVIGWLVGLFVPYPVVAATNSSYPGASVRHRGRCCWHCFHPSRVSPPGRVCAVLKETRVARRGSGPRRTA